VTLDWVKSLDRLLVEQPEPVTLVTLGPVTSLALALRREPDLVRAKVGRHIAMVGNIGARGNTTATPSSTPGATRRRSTRCSRQSCRPS